MAKTRIRVYSGEEPGVGHNLPTQDEQELSVLEAFSGIIEKPSYREELKKILCIHKNGGSINEEQKRLLRAQGRITVADDGFFRMGTPVSYALRMIRYSPSDDPVGVQCLPGFIPENPDPYTVQRGENFSYPLALRPGDKMLGNGGLEVVSRPRVSHYAAETVLVAVRGEYFSGYRSVNVWVALNSLIPVALAQNEVRTSSAKKPKK